MVATAPNSGIAYPTPEDIADVSKNMLGMALGIENMVAGVWIPWLPVIVQSIEDTAAGVSPLIVNGGSSVGKVSKVGKQVRATGKFVITVSPGSTGIPRLQLPYPATNLHQVVGWAARMRGGTNFPVSFTWNIASTSTAVHEIQVGTATNSFGVNDVCLVHLDYEIP